MSEEGERDFVLPQFRCPKCDENDPDRLEWLNDENVLCFSCGTIYNPLTREIGMEPSPDLDSRREDYYEAGIIPQKIIT